MNDKLLCKVLKFLTMETNNNFRETNEEERLELLNEIDEYLNPPEQQLIAERTHDAFSQKTEVKKE